MCGLLGFVYTKYSFSQYILMGILCWSGFVIDDGRKVVLVLEFVI